MPPHVDEAAFPASGNWSEGVRCLLGLTVLAPSTHNTQPWIFGVDGPVIDVRADLSRWLSVADADQREIYVSLGCAVETLVVAAEHFGLAASVERFPDPLETALAARVHLFERGSDKPFTESNDLFEAIRQRRTRRGAYDGRPLSRGDRSCLEAAGLEGETIVHLTDDPDVRRRVDELTVRADALQFADPEWRHELAHWLGEGVFGTNWLVSKLSQLAVHHLNLSRSVGKKDRELLDSASILGLITTFGTGHDAELLAGRTLQRLWLTATARGLALQPMNQILQVPEVRRELEELVPDDWGVPQVAFRLGYVEDGGDAPSSPRRPLEEVVRFGTETEAES